MKKFKKIISNLLYMTKTSAVFSPVQYFVAVFEIITDTVRPFINLYFPKLIIDELTMQKRWKYVLFFIILWAGVNIAMYVIQMLIGIVSSTYFITSRVKEDAFYGKMDAEMDYGMLENGIMHDEENRIKSNLSLPFFAFHPISDFLTNLFQLIGYTYIVATLHPLMILFLIVIVFISSLLSKRREKIGFEYQSDIARFKRRFDYLFSTLISYPFAKEIRINKAADWISQKYEKETDSYIVLFSKNQRKNFKTDIAYELISFAQTIALYVYSAYRVMIGAVTVGSFTLFIGAVTAFTGSCTGIIDKLNKLKYLSEYIDSYKQFIEKAVPSHIKNGVLDIDFSDEKSEFEFKNVSFKYPGCENYVLKNISLKIKNGERLSVVGYNGAGKSTFIKLLCRLYEPTEGQILYNDTDISTLKFNQYIKLLSVVFQDFNIYSLSVRENICLTGNVNDEELLLAIEQSGLADKIKTLPMGIDTQIGRDFDSSGIEFSGGEGQKLACARAYCKNAPVVILDEPTASLDPISESQLYQRFNNIIGKKTAIYISHRLASVKFCDKIAVFKEGSIAEYGTHDELIKLDGVYSEMFNKQAEYYVIEDEDSEEVHV